METLAQLLAWRAARTPDTLAYADETERVTWRALADDVEDLAASLKGNGIEGGCRIALARPSGVGFVRAFFALQRLGAIPCAFDPHVAPEILRKRAARIRPHFLIADTIEPIDPAADRSAADIAFLQSTSGTSGDPRAAIILQRNILASLRSAEELLEIREDDVLVSWVPPWHDLGLVRFVLGPVQFGAPCHFVPPAIRTIPRWLETIGEVRGTITGAPDFAYRLAVPMTAGRAIDLRSLRLATNGGEPVRRSTIAAFEERFGIRDVIRPGYGLAEGTLGVTCVRPGEPVLTDERGNVSCGPPLPGVEVRIADDDEIVVRSPAVFAGYFDDEESSAEALRDGWLHTGDLGRLDAGGNLYVLGRKRALIKRGGVAIAPRELEEAAQSVDGVRVAAAIGVAMEDRSEQTVVVLEVADPANGRDIATRVASAIRTAMGFAPDRTVVVRSRSIPRTENGKIRHAVLRSQFIAGELPIIATL